MKKLLPIFLLTASLLPHMAEAYAGEFFVNTGNENINALEATIHFPNAVNITEIRTGESAILIWIQTPVFDKETHAISFSGISPGGFRGNQRLFSFSGELGGSDLLGTSYSEVRALRGDGSGVAVPVTFSIQSKDSEEDLLPPEPFLLVTSRSPEIYDGKYFVSFLTQDKNSGVDHYEYASTWVFPPNEGAWQRVVSPLLLSRSDLFKKIYIRAIDKAGNSRRASLSGPYHYASFVLGLILILCVLAFTRRSFL